MNSTRTTGSYVVESVADAVRFYLGRGWAPIPIAFGSKAPPRHLKEWPDLRLSEADVSKYFGKDEGVGVILGSASRALVDVDVDCMVAVQLASAFLPCTGAVFGREGKQPAIGSSSAPA